MASPVEEIKSRLDIVDIIQGYTRLTKAGVNFRGLCPFHSEKTPSFFVSPSRQTWHCFGGCGTGGDMITFIERIEGVEFRDALKMLADRAGIKLVDENREARSERDKFFGILEEATKFYEGVLRSQIGKAAGEYLKSRGLTGETAKTFRIGYAPNDWRELTTHLTQIGFRPADIAQAGLAIKKDEGENCYDRFRHRIMFPLFDVNGRAIGFTGRVMPGGDDAMGKYVNTPQTALFDKSRFLYGLHATKTEIRRASHAILVEGQMDFLMSYQSGIKNVVAVSGTAFTNWHLTILKRYTDKLLFAFDMDSAGENATKRAIDLAQQAGFGVQIIRLTQGKDAADLARENPAAWQDATRAAVSLLEFYFAAAFGKVVTLTAETKRQITEELLPAIRRVPHAVEQAHWLGVLGDRIGIREDDLRTALRRLTADRPSPGAYTPQPGTLRAHVTHRSRKDLLLEDLAMYLHRFPQHVALAGELSETFRTELESLMKREDLALKSDDISDNEKEALIAIKDTIAALKSSGIREELAGLRDALHREEHAGNWEQVELLSKSIQLLSTQLKTDS